LVESPEKLLWLQVSSETTGRHAGQAMEHFGEMTLIREADGHRDIQNSELGVPQKSLCPFEAPADDKAVRALSHAAAKTLAEW
jgi:hypothetical protein